MMTLELGDIFIENEQNSAESQVQGLVKAQQIHASFFQRLQALISVAFYGKRKYPSMVFQ